MEGREGGGPDHLFKLLNVLTAQMEDGKAEVSSLAELLTSSVEKAVQQTGATPTSGAPLDGVCVYEGVSVFILTIFLSNPSGSTR